MEELTKLVKKESLRTLIWVVISVGLAILIGYFWLG